MLSCCPSFTLDPVIEIPKNHHHSLYLKEHTSIIYISKYAKLTIHIFFLRKRTDQNVLLASAPLEACLCYRIIHSEHKQEHNYTIILLVWIKNHYSVTTPTNFYRNWCSVTVVPSPSYYSEYIHRYRISAIWRSSWLVTALELKPHQDVLTK